MSRPRNSNAAAMIEAILLDNETPKSLAYTYGVTRSAVTTMINRMGVRLFWTTEEERAMLAKRRANA